MPPLLVLTLAAALLLAAVHAVTPSLRFLKRTPRSAWLSIAGGVSVAYVFVHLLPEFAAGQESVGRAVGGLALAERHVYLIALVGLLFFYGLDRLAKLSRSQREGAAVEAGLLGGGVVLNVLKEEVPSERQSRFWAFALGSGIYAALLLTV